MKPHEELSQLASSRIPLEKTEKYNDMYEMSQDLDNGSQLVWLAGLKGHDRKQLIKLSVEYIKPLVSKLDKVKKYVNNLDLVLDWCNGVEVTEEQLIESRRNLRELRQEISTQEERRGFRSIMASINSALAEKTGHVDPMERIPNITNAGCDTPEDKKSEHKKFADHVRKNIDFKKLLK